VEGLTVQEILTDDFTSLGLENWSELQQSKEFKPEIVENVYQRLRESQFDFQKRMLLEVSHYLEK
jgi:hypothetical protein